MTLLLALLLACWLVPSLFHVASLGIVALRLRGEAGRVPARKSQERISIVRTINGVEQDVERCLESGFCLDDRHYELIFCAHTKADPVVRIVQALMVRHPDVPARLLCQDLKISDNPKLNNMAQGWGATHGVYVCFSDGNIVLPPDYLARHLAAWTPVTGVVSAIHIGDRPQGFWAEVECAFLNQYHARWHLMAGILGIAFCCGKSMLIRRADLEASGGIKALASEAAEDVALTKLTWAQGRRVTPIIHPVVQPLGPRSASGVMRRQIRWARLRRLGYPAAFSCEILSTALIPIGSAGALALLRDGTVWAGIAIAAQSMFWYGSELIFARAVGMHLSLWATPASIVRDAAIPVIWLYGWFGRRFWWGSKLVYGK
jgi:ceramide glucosyltransferase